MKSYLIIKVEQCEGCQGSGMIQPPVWGRFWQEYSERFGLQTPGALEATDFYDAFWRSEGYDPSSIPEEEEPCPECEGQGHIETRVRLEEALMAILPRALAEIDRQEELARMEADAAALLEDLEQGEVEGYGEGEDDIPCGRCEGRGSDG